MAKAKLTPLLQGLHGQVGELVFKHYGSRVVVTCKPDMSRVEWSPAQQQGRARFRRAAQYAKQAMANPHLKARYAAAGKERGTPAYRVALADALNSPVVEALDWAGYHGGREEKIRIWGRDDFEVTGIQVEITLPDGTLLEQGEAIQGRDGWWEYISSSVLLEGTSVRVTVTAHDQAGNTTIREEQKQM